MKKIIVVSLLFLPVMVFAQGFNARMGASTTVEVRKASSTERRVELQLDIVKRQAAKTYWVLTSTIERLESIMTRVESRIAKVKAEGGVATESEVFVAEAGTHLAEAKGKLAVFTSITFSADKLRDNVIKLREAAAEVKVHIRAAHTSLMNAVRSLRK